MGYIFLLVIGTVVVVGIFVMFVGGRRRSGGQVEHGRDVTVKRPAADEPTPTGSSTATNAQARAAEKKIPPA
jgi:hypothetical protein